MSNLDMGKNDNQRKRAPRWMWVTLISSLAVNLLIIGIVGGAAYKWRHGGHWGGHGFGGPMAKYISTLPDERRSEIRKTIHAHFMKLRPQWKEVHRARKKVSESLKVEPFNRTGFEAALSELRSAEFAARESMTPVLSELAAKLSPKERMEFLRHQTRRHKWRRHHNDEGAELEKTEGTSAPLPEGTSTPLSQTP